MKGVGAKFGMSRGIKRDKLNVSQIFADFADFRFSWELQHFGGADFRRKPQIFAENRRKPQILFGGMSRDFGWDIWKYLKSLIKKSVCNFWPLISRGCVGVRFHGACRKRLLTENPQN